MNIRHTLFSSVLGAVLLATPSVAEDRENYSPNTRADYPDSVYWGDAHLHTSYSLDADLGGFLKVTPEQSYAFARGEEVITTSGQPVRLHRPLDFVVVADHAGYMGLWRRLREDDPQLHKSETGRNWLERYDAGPEAHQELVMELVMKFIGNKGKFRDPELDHSVWLEVIENAEKFNDPGKFTAFIGYEWTSNVAGNNLHRVVVFKDGKDKTASVTPFSFMDSTDPEDLWAYFENYESSTGGEVLAIPHNGNLSNGLMFSPNKYGGDPIDTAYAKSRARWEPLFEVTQMKGDSEAHPLLSPDDLFADFETWDNANISQITAKEDWMLQYEYARSALKLGIQFENTLGTNPFKFGMMGGTDSHTGVSAIEENSFWGKAGYTEPRADRWKSEFMKRAFVKYIWELNAAGIAAVWARENTRESLFNAMKRKETYATTGPRMSVRFFGGWNFDENDAYRPDLARIGYEKGVPMGGDLTSGESGAAPNFLVRAVKDPDGANLDRVQIVKGWVDDDGETQEKVYDVALSKGAKKRASQKAKGEGGTINFADATYLNSIGEPELAVVWTDPDFETDQRAFYYVRVLEIPTPRWTAYDAAFYDFELPADIPREIQERAYTSPIWYTP